MDQLLTAAAAMTGLAFLFGAILAAANRYLRVQEDPRIDQVEEMLPGNNCGACGQAGCRAFAEQVVAGAVAPAKCTVSSASGIERIAGYLGVDAGEQEKRVARLHCAGGTSSVQQRAHYAGLRSCRAAFLVGRGGRNCAYGCLGFGDCERACTFRAIAMNRENLPVVSVEACTACGDCVEACPLSLFTIEPLSHRVIVQCSSPLSGEQARASCQVACDACGRCAADAPNGVIEMVDGLPVLREPARATADCTYRCPTGAIASVDGAQLQYDVSVHALRRRHG